MWDATGRPCRLFLFILTIDPLHGIIQAITDGQDCQAVREPLRQQRRYLCQTQAIRDQFVIVNSTFGQAGNRAAHQPTKIDGGPHPL